MKEYENIVKDIKNKVFFPVYFLMGDEPFFIDNISNLLEETVLNEDEKVFNLTITYAKDTSIEEIITTCKQYPMGSEKTLVIVKEAQNLSKNIDLLENYLNHLSPSTILVINYKGKTLDKRKKLYKLINEKGLIVESKKVYDNLLPQWINTIVQSKNLSIEPKASFLLQEYIGNDLSRIENEIDKLKIHLSNHGVISMTEIEKYIGISKEYNGFELINAICVKDREKSFKIAKKLTDNEKDNPIFQTMGLIYILFSNLLILHGLTDKSNFNIAKELKINPYFVNNYKLAANNYSLKKCTTIISCLREADANKKGVNIAGISDFNIYKELLFKIFA